MKETQTNKMDTFWTLVKFAVISIALAFILRGLVFIPFPVTGISMEETIYQGDQVIMEKFSKLERFDIVVFKRSDGSTYIKRIIGLPGEKISYKADQLYVNDVEVAEPFLKKEIAEAQTGIFYTPDFEAAEVLEGDVLAENEYFLMGDNRRLSKDSRSFGAVPAADILGKALLIYYPFNHLKIL